MPARTAAQPPPFGNAPSFAMLTHSPIDPASL